MLATRTLFVIVGCAAYLPSCTNAFTTASFGRSFTKTREFDKITRFDRRPSILVEEHYSKCVDRHTSNSQTLSMSQSGEDGGGSGGGLTALILVGIIGIFVVSGVAPMLQMATGPNAIDNTMALGDAVATRSDNVKYQVAQKQSKDEANSNMVTQYEKLSRTKIQEKLNRVPVFYLTDGDENLSSQIFITYDDAKAEAEASDKTLNVQCTTLDQVMYPLILKRGRMRMAPPPGAIQKAEALLEDSNYAENTKFQLIPSSKARNDAADLGLSNVPKGDIPLFAANKLAFAGQQGPQIPLFLEKDDCVTSYKRLKETSKNSKLEDQPTIRVTTLREVLFSMERGTRPAVSQLQFYTTERDLLRASQMIG